ncbi:MAG TPA: CinA family nicotinamide mononucleotide deamidase-related protein [Myxococcota bacterium]|nr:CinA family nicotinamide mononucleotide deamidase-related protein [Myxococcota bacterium]
MRIEILTIGNELLNGDLADTNTQRLARFARARGLFIQAAQTVPDTLEAIVDALALAARRADLILVSGGLGPTSDDLTLEAAARFAGVELTPHAPTVARLEARFAERGLTMTPNNLRQARVPATAEVFDNPVGTAPHVQLQVGATRLFFFPGVPHELARLCDDYLGPWLEENAPIRRYRSAIFRTFGKTESGVASLIERALTPEPRMHVAYRAHFPEIQVSLHVDEADADEAERLLLASATIVREQLADIVFSERADEGLVEVVARELTARGETLALAESCTGGLVARMCTELAGASRWFLEGFVTYSNTGKSGRLGVDPALIEAHGAVSEAVARAMAEGAQKVTGADWALSITGIAGPDGGTADKPVGTVHLALAGPDGTTHLSRRYPFDRSRNRTVSAYAALDLLRRALAGRPTGRKA